MDVLLGEVRADGFQRAFVQTIEHKAFGFLFLGWVSPVTNFVICSSAAETAFCDLVSVVYTFKPELVHFRLYSLQADSIMVRSFTSTGSEWLLEAPKGMFMGGGRFFLTRTVSSYTRHDLRLDSMSTSKKLWTGTWN